jgi:hypothetical protein
MESRFLKMIVRIKCTIQRQSMTEAGKAIIHKVKDIFGALVGPGIQNLRREIENLKKGHVRCSHNEPNFG